MQEEEAVCRALCAADGRDPDALTWPLSDPDAENRIGGGDIVIDSEGHPARLRPRWQNYRAMAKRMIAAFEELHSRRI